MKNLWTIGELQRQCVSESQQFKREARAVLTILTGPAGPGTASTARRFISLLHDKALHLIGGEYANTRLVAYAVGTALLIEPDSAGETLSIIVSEAKRLQPFIDPPWILPEGFVRGCILGSLLTPVLLDRETDTKEGVFLRTLNADPLGRPVLCFLAEFLRLSFFGHVAIWEPEDRSLLSTLVADFVGAAAQKPWLGRIPIIREFLENMRDHIASKGRFSSDLEELIVTEFVQKTFSKTLTPVERLAAMADFMKVKATA